MSVLALYCTVLLLYIVSSLKRVSVEKKVEKKPHRT